MRHFRGFQPGGTATSHWQLPRKATGEENTWENIWENMGLLLEIFLSANSKNMVIHIISKISITHENF